MCAITGCRRLASSYTRVAACAACFPGWPLDLAAWCSRRRRRRRVQQSDTQALNWCRERPCGGVTGGSCLCRTRALCNRVCALYQDGIRFVTWRVEAQLPVLTHMHSPTDTCQGAVLWSCDLAKTRTIDPPASPADTISALFLSHPRGVLRFVTAMTNSGLVYSLQTQVGATPHAHPPSRTLHHMTFRALRCLAVCLGRRATPTAPLTLEGATHSCQRSRMTQHTWCA